ncbi:MULTISPECIES: hypothetical protein [unclassified Phenylobacterium]|uniref:hypothetical protein n=1 Tax=unclassified Phenylobacterium TaxID=2640670 RepID=UPI00083B1F19|nr:MULTISPECIES: hypothetical protein [unclassified Phenylobacterium]
MSLFTFYPCRPDGSAPAFETIDCHDDEDALSRAPKVLEDHQSAVEVVIWQGERRVGVLVRATSAA